MAVTELTTKFHRSPQGYDPNNPPFGKPWGYIVGVLHDRRRESTPLFNAMTNVRSRYNGPALDFVLPWWSGADDEHQSMYTPLLIAELVDNHALQAASVDTTLFSPAINPGKQTGVRSRQYARIRTSALEATYDRSRWPLGRRRLFRQLSAYASCAALCMPDDDLEMPRIEIRDVLTSFPDMRAAEDLRDHEDVGFITGRSAEWLRHHYPESRDEMGGVVPERPGDDEQLWDVAEWIDRESIVIGIMGPRETRFGQSTWADGYEQSIMELRRWPNRAEMVPCMLPARVTLDTILSQVMNLTGHVDLIAKMQLLDVIQSEKSLQPDMFILGADGRAPRVLSNGGEWAEGRQGIMNELMNVQNVGTISQQPDPLGRATIDRVERNFRMSGGLVPQFGGESHGPLRTGRAIDAMAGMAVEPRIQELHEIMEAWQPVLNEAILRTYKGYYGSKKYSMYTGRTASMSQFEFTPNEHIEEVYDSSARYAIAGAGVVETNVIIAQLLGTELTSKRTARRRHPWVDDADEEQRLIDEEAAEEAMKASIFQRVLAGEAPMELLQFFEEARRDLDNPDAIAAFAAATRKLQEIQAQAPPPPPPGMMAAPEAMPGANAGPDGAMMQQPPPPTPDELGPGAEGTTPEQQGIREVFNALQATTRTI